MDYSYFSELNAEDLDDYIMHYGVKGMKWGVVKERVRSSASSLRDRGSRFIARRSRMAAFELRTHSKSRGEQTANKHRGIKIRFKKKNDISNEDAVANKPKQPTQEELIAKKKRDILSASGDAKARAVYDNINLFSDQELVGIRNRLALESSVREYRDRVPNYNQAEQQARINQMRNRTDQLRLTSDAVRSGITMWNYGAAAYNAFAKPAEQLPIVNTNFNNKKNDKKNNNNDDDD